MKQFTLAAVLGLMTVASACGGNTQQAPAPADAPAAPAAGPVDITLANESNLQAGENTFEVMVMQGTQPVTDADVSLDFFMAAMPEMKMAEMKNSVALKHEGGGRYTGTGNVMMAGNWDTTVMVMRGGQELGTRKLTVTAK